MWERLKSVFNIITSLIRTPLVLSLNESIAVFDLYSKRGEINLLYIDAWRVAVYLFNNQDIFKIFLLSRQLGAMNVGTN